MSNEAQAPDTEPQTTRSRRPTVSDASGLLRDATKRIIDANVPPGMWSASAQTAAQAPTLVDIRQAKYIPQRAESAAKLQQRRSASFTGTPATPSEPRQPMRSDSWKPNIEPYEEGTLDGAQELDNTALEVSMALKPSPSGRYPNGYKFPPKHTWRESLAIGFQAFLRFLITPFGILTTIYGLNVVAWGAMIFFLLIGAASETMCFVQRPYGSGHYVHDCNDLYSPRRIWIEIDSQVLTALFCVTAFGLVPWRFRDLWSLMRWRLTGHITSLRKLAAWHRGWFRLPGSDQLDPTCIFSNYDSQYHIAALPEPTEKAPDAPLTGVRATPTSLWRMDFVVWSMAFNTFMQVVLCYFMWGMNRFDRPSWATGLFVTLGCVSAGLGGILQFIEGKRIKSIEGIAPEVGQAVAEVAEKRESLDEGAGLEEV